MSVVASGTCQHRHLSFASSTVIADYAQVFLAGEVGLSPVVPQGTKK